MLSLLLQFVLVLSLAGGSAAQPTGSIRGTVVDQQGTPVEKAKVEALISYRNGRPVAFMGVVPFGETNAEGEFVIKNLNAGQYRISAGKEADGYPDSAPDLYRGDKVAPTVTVEEDVEYPPVRIQLLPKAGLLTPITIIDAATGANITTHAAMTLRRVDNPKASMGGTILKPELVPSDTDVTVEVTAPGYQPWPEGGALFHIRLGPGETMRLDVPMRKGTVEWTGSITGIVVDQQGAPVEGARVEYEREEGNLRGLVPAGGTNQDGQFVIKNLVAGSYRIYAGKEAEGYPDSNPDLHRGANVAPTVMLEQGVESPPVTVPLLPKAGVLEPIIVTDAATGKDLTTRAALTLRRADNPRASIAWGGIPSRALMPSDTDVLVEISAPGYESWPEDGEPFHVHLGPGETKGLEVQMHAAPKGKNRPSLGRRSGKTGSADPVFPRVPSVSPMSVPFGHSARKACMGSVDAARRAGTKQAISVARQRRMATITKVSQSAVPTP
jgi:hypothetical protein